MTSKEFEAFRDHVRASFGTGEMGWRDRMRACLIAKRLAQGEPFTAHLVAQVNAQADRVADAKLVAQDRVDLQELFEVLKPHEKTFKSLRSTGQIAELFKQIYGW